MNNNEIITPNHEISRPTHLQQKDYLIHVLLGQDTLNIIHSLVSITTGRPKGACINQCYGLNIKEKDIEHTLLPQEEGKYPIITIRAAVTEAQFFQAKTVSAGRGLRCLHEEKALFVALGFNPEEMKPNPEMQEGQ